jgi:DNA-binding NtrC family response regulator
MSPEKSKKLLVIDDEPGLRDMIRFDFSERGYDVVTASCGEEAVTRACTEKFNLALCDIRMPGMSGMETLRKLKHLQPDMHVVMVTGYPSIESAVEMIKHGAAEYLTKPYDLNSLDCVCKRLLASHESDKIKPKKISITSRGNGKLKLLVIDDEPGLRNMMLFDFTQRGYEVVAASDGEEAIAKARKEKFDLALCDIRMPGMGGEETLRKLKQLRPEMHVIMVTGYPSIESAVETIKLGASEYVAKPYDLDCLDRVCKKLTASMSN